MRHYLLLTLAAGTAFTFATSASAQSPAPAVTVAIGPALQQKAKDYGPRELVDLGKDLQDTVQGNLRHAKATPPVKIDLVIEDAVPNRPTFDQLGRTPSLSYGGSHGLGGARISGVATYADGSQRPIHEQFFESDLRDDHGATTWFDADRAFEQAAYDISRGKYSDRYAGPGPSGSGHFGYPFGDR